MKLMKILLADNMIIKRIWEDGRIGHVIVYCKQNITTVNEIKAFFHGYPDKKMFEVGKYILKTWRIKGFNLKKLFESLKQNKKMKISSCYE